MVRKSVPLADQVILEILSGIDSGEMVRHGGLLPSEAELSQRFHVSRGTVREALAKLELTGIVIRRHGIGTYVSQLVGDHPARIQCWFDEAAGFMDLLRSCGQQAERRLLAASVKSAGPLALPLGLDPEELVLSAEKLFLSNAGPIIHCVNVIPLSLIEPGRRETVIADYWESESTYQFLDQRCGRPVHHQKSEVRAVLADETLAGLLNCQVGDPLLRVEEVGYSSDLTALFYGLNHYRGDAVSLLQVRRPTLNVTGPVS